MDSIIHCLGTLNVQFDLCDYAKFRYKFTS
jgi:hypothetical protein